MKSNCKLLELLGELVLTERITQKIWKRARHIMRTITVHWMVMIETVFFAHKIYLKNLGCFFYLFYIFDASAKVLSKDDLFHAIVTEGLYYNLIE
jgi:hypothetical protein